MSFQPSTPLSDRLMVPASTRELIERRSSSLVFIDSSVNDYQSLVSAVQPGMEIQVLDSAQDAIEQMTQALMGRTGISSLHLVSHGKAGALQLGRSWLTESSLQNVAAQIRQWGEALTEDADILLYGCNVAAGELGQAFLDRLSQLVSADVAASEDWTGSSALGGDWILERATGEITSPIAFDASALSRYSSFLPSSNVVISQIYGGGGNSGATYRNDFIELFNNSPIAVDLSGWSVQYAAATGDRWQVTALSGVIAPYGYYLIQQARGTTGGSIDLPLPDQTGGVNLGATNGKVALVSSTTALTGTNPTGTSVVDLVGYGSANGFETRAVAALTNTTAAQRRSGHSDTDNNQADFSIAAPTPRNSSTPAELPMLSVTAGTVPIENTLTNGNFTVTLNRPLTADLTVNFNLAGSATQGSDYNLIAGTGIRSVGADFLVIAAGTTTATLVVQPIDDQQAEANETIQLTLTSGTSYAIDTPTGSLAIAPNDFVVTNTQDAGEGSLRQAILNANAIAGANTITFAGVFSDGDSNDTISLSSELELTEEITLTGGGVSAPTIEAGDRFAIFRVNAGVSASFNQIIFRNGDRAIANLGTIRVSNSTFSGNGTAIFNNSTIASISNSTFSGNTVGIHNASGTIETLVNNTIAGSTNVGIENSGQITNLHNNLLVSNGNNAIDGAIVNSSHNLTGTYASVGLAAVLGSYGGLTPTHALLPGSGAIDAGIRTEAPDQDQRGVARIGDVDVGAFESRGFILTPVSGSNQSSRIETSFTPLVVRVDSAFDEPVDGGTITFVSPTVGASTNSTRQTAIVTSKQASLTLTANAIGGSYAVTAIAAGSSDSANFSLTNLVPLPPTISVSDVALDYAENDPATVIDAIGSVSDPDSANFDGGILTVNWTAGGTADDRLGIRSLGAMRVSGAEIRWNDEAIGTFEGGEGTTPLIIRFNANATPTTVSALLQNLTYANVSDNPATAVRSLQFVLTDGGGGTSPPVAKTIQVTPRNDTPVLEHNFTIAEGGSLILTSANLSATDADGTTDLSFIVSGVTNGQFEWIDRPGVAISRFTAAEIDSGQVRFVHDGSESAPRFNVSVSDGTDSTPSVAAAITFRPVNDAPVNRVPTAETTIANVPIFFNAIAIADADAGSNLVQVTLRATNGKLSLSRTEGLILTEGTGISDSTMILTGTIATLNARLNGLSFAPTPDYTGAATLEITTSDRGASGDGSAQEDTDTISITVNPADNSAPSITGIPAIRIDEDTPYRFTPTAIDPDRDPLTFSIANLPNWATFDSATGTLSGTPTNRDVGTTRNIRIRVRDASGAIADLPLFDLTVNNVNDAPTVATSIADRVAIAGKPLTFTLPANTFVDFDAGDRLVWSANLVDGRPLPTWLRFDAATRQFHVNPAVRHVGAIEIQVQASDSANAVAIERFRLTVQPPDRSMTGSMGRPTPTIVFSSPIELQVKGTARNDFLKGSWFNDRLEGGAGDDVLSSGYGKARLGEDRLYGGAGNDRLYSGAGRDRLQGDAGNDRLYAGKARDLLLGGAGDDWLNGEQGNDILVGGAGNDTLIGGSGHDRLVFQAIDQGIDWIEQFEIRKDVIDLRSIFKQSQFSGKSDFEQYQKFVRLVQVGADTEIRIDADGRNLGQQFVTIARLRSISVTAIHSTHFVV